MNFERVDAHHNEIKSALIHALKCLIYIYTQNLTERESKSDDITSSFHHTVYRILAPTVIFDTRNQRLSFYTKTDFDECKDQDLNKCHEKAKCTNTEGSYNCTCIDGYVGDGFRCQGDGYIFVVYFLTIYIKSFFQRQTSSLDYVTNWKKTV